MSAPFSSQERTARAEIIHRRADGVVFIHRSRSAPSPPAVSVPHRDLMTRARIIGVSGASGGVGASCLVAALGVRARQRGAVCALVDLRRHGGGLDVVLGVDHEPGLRWPDLTRARGRLDIPDILPRLPRGAGVPAVSFERTSAAAPDAHAIRAVIDGLAGYCDLIVVDLPELSAPEFGVAAALLHEGLIVCGFGPTQLAAAGVHARALEASGVAWSIVQRVARGSPEDLPALVCDALGLRVVAVLSDDDRVTADLRRGRVPGGRGALAEAADQVLESIRVPLGRAA